jgi:hypothetical protein
VNRADFEHVIRAAADIAEDEIVVVGSQAILGQHPDAPESLLVSSELDVFPKNRPDRSIDIDGALGDGSPFHERFGYYAQGVGWETVYAPAGWRQRLVRVEIDAAVRGTAVAWCIEKHDLVLAKLAAGRPHDFEFVEMAIREGLVDRRQLRLGAQMMPASHLKRTVERLERLLLPPDPTAP